MSFLPTILRLYIQTALSRKPFAIGHMFIWSFVLRMTDTMTSQNMDLTSWDTLYFIVTFNVCYRESPDSVPVPAKATTLHSFHCAVRPADCSYTTSHMQHDDVQFETVGRSEDINSFLGRTRCDLTGQTYDDSILM